MIVFARDKMRENDKKNRINKKLKKGRNRHKILKRIHVTCFKHVNKRERERGEEGRTKRVVYIDGQKKY